MKKVQLLIIGSIPDEKHKLRYGGATVLMQNYLDYLRHHEIPFTFIQNNRFSNLKTGDRRVRLNKVFFITIFLIKIWFCKIVMFNFSDSGTVNFFPILSKFAKSIGKKTVLRKFGGSLEVYLSTKDDAIKNNALTALKNADLILFETKAGIEYIISEIGTNANIQWFPNNRNLSSLFKDRRNFSRRCVYISHIKEEKGIDVFLEVASKMSPEYSFDLYGAVKEEKYRSLDYASYNVVYHGQIPSSDVLKTLLDYDILLLPSYREGYPGIIIEALSVGIPVVAFEVGGIPEIIKDKYNGLLVKPGDVTGFIKSIRSITKDDYFSLSENARTSFIENFESEKTNKRITDSIFSLI